MKRTALKKISPERKEKIEGEREARRKEYAVFEEIWNERPHRSEVSGEFLGREIRNVFFDHLLEKSKYPEFRYEKENIALVTFMEHDSKTRGFPDPKHQLLIDKAKERFLNKEAD